MLLTDFPQTKTPPGSVPGSAVAAPIGAHSVKVAIAVGAGFAKVYDGASFYRLRSLVTREIPCTGAASAVQLRVKISNSAYAGEFAAGENLDSSTTLQSLADGLKAAWYPPLALAMLGKLAPAHVELFNVALVASIPSPNMAAALAPLVGLHDVTVNGRRVTVNVTGVRPVPEGLGTAFHIANGQPVAVLDLGYQNATIAGYDPSTRQMIDVVSLNGGVSELFAEISRLTNTTGTAPTAEAIRLGVEARTYQFYGYSGDGFRSAYEQAFEPWLKARLHEAKTKASHIFNRCPVKVLAGGGSLLPGVASVATAIGVSVCDQPQQTELKGIYRI